MLNIKVSKAIYNVSFFTVGSILTIKHTSHINFTQKTNLYYYITNKCLLQGKKENKLLNCIKKHKININLTFEQNKPAKAIFNKNLTILGDICEISQNKPLLQEEILNNFAKNDLFDAKLTIKLENVFLTKQKLNNFRRLCC